MNSTVIEQTSPKSKKRIGYFDIAKGFAMLCIVISHSMGVNLNNYPESNLLLIFLFSFHVPIFFVISGYFYKNRAGNVKKYAIRLIKPYIFTSLCVIILDILSQCFKHIFFDRSNFLWDVLSVFGDGELKAFWGSGVSGEFLGIMYFDGIGAIWFLLALIWAVVFFVGIEKVSKIKKLKQPWTNIAELLLVLILLASALTISSYTSLPFSILPGMISEIFFFVGFKYKEVVSKYDFVKNLFGKTWWKIIILIYCVIIWVSDIIFSYYIGYMSIAACILSNVFINVFGALAASYFIIEIFKYIEQWNILKRIQTFLKFIGQNTVIVLCFHLIELKFFPWDIITDNLSFFGLGRLLVIVLKVIWCCIGIWIVNHSNWLKKVFN